MHIVNKMGTERAPQHNNGHINGKKQKAFPLRSQDKETQCSPLLCNIVSSPRHCQCYEEKWRKNGTEMTSGDGERGTVSFR